MIGHFHGFAVVFDHDDRVAQIAQIAEGVDEFAIVAGVQANTGFVEHVENTDEAGSDLCGEANALKFTS